MADCATCGVMGCPRRQGNLPPGMADRYDLNASRFDGFLVWIEIERDADGTPHIADVSKEILGRVKSLDDARVWGIVFGHAELKPLYPEIFSYGVETLYEVHSKELIGFDAKSYAEAIGQVAERIEPALILLGDDEKGRILAPAIPLKNRKGLILGCERISMDLCAVTAVCSDLGGAFRRSVETEGFPQVITVSPGAYPVPETDRRGEGTVIYWQYRKGQ